MATSRVMWAPAVDYTALPNERQESIHDTAASAIHSSASNHTKYKAPERISRKDIWNDSWLWEIICISLSASCLIALLVLLKMFDKQPLPQLSYGLTFNAIISILVTVSRTSLSVAIAAGISQLKWHWYRRERHTAGKSMLDIQLYDNASRGPWGSLVFLITPHAWSWASIGALITIIVLTLDPFAQQLARYPLRDFPIPSNGNSTPPVIPRAETLSAGDSYAESQQFLYHDVVSAISSSIWADSADSYIYNPVCAGDTCTWDGVESLAFCSSCEDKTGDWHLDGCRLQFNLSRNESKLLFIDADTKKMNMGATGCYVKNSCTIGTTEHEHVDVGTWSDSLEAPDWIDKLNMMHNYQQPLNISVESFVSEDPDGRGRRRIVQPTELLYNEQAIWLVDENCADTYAKRQAAGLDIGAENKTALPLLSMGSVKLQYDRKVRSDGLSIKAASLCTLTPCVKKYQVKVQNGTSQSQVDDIRYGEFYYRLYPTTDDDYWSPQSNWSLERSGAHNLAHVSAGPPNSSYHIDWDSMSQIAYLIQDTFAGSMRNTVRKEWPELENKTIITFFADFDPKNDSQILNVASKYDPYRTTYVSNAALGQIVQEGGLEWVMPRIADSLSRMMRDRSGISVPGQAFVSIQSVEVRWEWLILPIFAVASGIIFLALTMCICRGPDYFLWKSSSLPLLYHNMERWDIIRDVQSSSHDVDRVGGMESLAKNTVTRLRRDEVDGELRFVRMEQISRRATDE